MLSNYQQGNITNTYAFSTSDTCQEKINQVHATADCFSSKYTFQMYMQYFLENPKQL